MQKFLTTLDRKDLLEQHKKERDRRVADRIKAVLLFDNGWRYVDIAEALLLTEDAIRHHINEYKAQEKLKPENGGSTSKLNQEKTDALLAHLEENIYLHVNKIVVYVKHTFDVAYTVSGMTSWLHNQGFSYKKPAIVPGKADKEAQEGWIKKYEDLKAHLPKDEIICFTDGVHPTHNVKAAYGWIKRGKREEIPTNTGRQRLNISGALDIVNHRVFQQEADALNAETTITFLQMLEDAYPGMKKIHLYCDNARYYKNKKVSAYLVQSKIALHFLPSYSPNLNPIERLWKLMNEQVLYNKYYEKFDDFSEAISDFFKRLADPLESLRTIFKSRVRDKFRVMGSPIFSGA